MNCPQTNSLHQTSSSQEKNSIFSLTTHCSSKLRFRSVSGNLRLRSRCLCSFSLSYLGLEVVFQPEKHVLQFLCGNGYQASKKPQGVS